MQIFDQGNRWGTWGSQLIGNGWYNARDDSFWSLRGGSARCELRKPGVKIKLQKQPFQILQMLLECLGEVITREEMRKKIWPPDTFVDFEQGLHSAIKRLREAVGDSADNPGFTEVCLDGDIA
jgi:DNA-binding response OmpR family regulator